MPGPVDDDERRRRATVQRGSYFGKGYFLLERIGGGGQADVWLAWVEGGEVARGAPLQNHVVIKMAHEGGRARLALEKVRLERLKGEHHVIRLLDHDLEHSPPYVVLEVLLGPSLHQLMHEQGHLEFAEVVCVLVQVADALGHLHAHGIVHRDVNPTNIQIHSWNGPGAVGRIGWVELIDFGIAYVKGEQRLTELGKVVGCSTRIPPEGRQGRAFGPAYDVWSLALVAFELLRGLPQGSEDFERLDPGYFEEQLLSHGRLRRGSTEAPLPASVRKMVLAALSDDPSVRPQTAAEFVAPFVAALNDFGTTVPLHALITPRTQERDRSNDGASAPVSTTGEFEIRGSSVATGHARATSPSWIGSQRRWARPAVALVLALAVGIGATLAVNAERPSDTSPSAAIDDEAAASSGAPPPETSVPSEDPVLRTVQRLRPEADAGVPAVPPPTARTEPSLAPPMPAQAGHASSHVAAKPKAAPAKVAPSRRKSLEELAAAAWEAEARGSESKGPSNDGVDR